jgi:hypothetical protein
MACDFFTALPSFAAYQLMCAHDGLAFRFGSYAAGIGSDEQACTKHMACNRLYDLRPARIFADRWRLREREELEDIIVDAMTGGRVRWQPALREITVSPYIPTSVRTVPIANDRPFRKAMLANRQMPDESVYERVERRRIGSFDYEGEAGRAFRESTPYKRRRDAFSVGCKTLGNSGSVPESGAGKINPDCWYADLFLNDHEFGMASPDIPEQRA